MADEQNIKIYTGADIARYHSGEMSNAESHAIERAALEDPFLADAIEGYLHTENPEADLADLNDRLGERAAPPVVTMKRGAVYRRWLRAAVLLFAVAGAALLAYQIGFNERDREIAGVPADVKRTAGESPARTVSPEPKADQSESNTSTPPPASPATAAPDRTPQVNLNADKPSGLNDDRNTSVAAKTKRAVAAGTKQAETASPPPAPAPAEYDLNETKDVAYQQPSLRTESDNKTSWADKVRPLVAGKPTTRNDNLRLFRGRVTDQANNAVPFANVTNLQDSVGTYTDAKGYFTLVSPDSVLSVQVRSLGYENRRAELQTVIPNNQVALKEDNLGLDALVLNSRQANTNRARSNMMVLEEPEPADGWVNYDTYIINNLKVPEQYARREALHGEVELSVEVNDEGEPVKVTVLKSLCESCDREAIRLILNGPKWKKKGRKGTTTVRVPF